MATTVYKTATVSLIDGTEVELSPLKIKYLREFMNAFELVKTADNDDEAIVFLSNCAAVAMKQYYPKISNMEDLQDSIDLKGVYKVLEFAAGIKINEKSKDTVKDQAEAQAIAQAKGTGSSWESLDLAKLEAEVFLLGIWKNYEELELQMSIPELMASLETRRDLDYQEKKFLAAIQGVDLDKSSGQAPENKWEEMKARVFSGGKATSGNDVLALQGANAQRAGFGIGMGIGYEDLTKKK
jgi:hypothetical protein